MKNLKPTLNTMHEVRRRLSLLDKRQTEITVSQAFYAGLMSLVPRGVPTPRTLYGLPVRVDNGQDEDFRFSWAAEREINA